MRTAPDDMNFKSIAGSHDGAATRGDGADGKIWPAMQCVDFFSGGSDARAVEGAFIHHALATTAAFFRRLEDEGHWTRKRMLRSEARKYARCADQHRGVSIMTAGMHSIGSLGGPRLTAAFVDWQCIHVSAQRDGARAGAGNVRKNACSARKSCNVGNAGVGEFAKHYAAGAHFFVTNFRMHMQVMTKFDEAWKLLTQQGANDVREWMRVLLCW